MEVMTKSKIIGEYSKRNLYFLMIQRSTLVKFCLVFCWSLLWSQIIKGDISYDKVKIEFVSQAGLLIFVYLVHLIYSIGCSKSNNGTWGKLFASFHILFFLMLIGIVIVF